MWKWAAPPCGATLSATVCSWSSSCSGLGVVIAVLVVIAMIVVMVAVLVVTVAVMMPVLVRVSPGHQVGMDVRMIAARVAMDHDAVRRDDHGGSEDRRQHRGEAGRHPFP